MDVSTTVVRDWKEAEKAVTLAPGEIKLYLSLMKFFIVTKYFSSLRKLILKQCRSDASLNEQCSEYWAIIHYRYLLLQIRQIKFYKSSRTNGRRRLKSDVAREQRVLKSEETLLNEPRNIYCRLKSPSHWASFANPSYHQTSGIVICRNSYLLNPKP